MRTVMRMVLAVGTAGVLAMAGSGVGLASPTQDDGQQASCNYTLSAPSLIEVSGRTMVTATLSSLPCTGVVLPNEQTVCVQLQGDGSPPQCKFAPGYVVAQVYYAPYRPGATYTSTGKGCAATAPSQVSTCATQGPISTVL